MPPFLSNSCRLAWCGMPLNADIAAQLPSNVQAQPHVRIPALTVTTSGRIIAAFDLRPSFHDLPGELSIGYRISNDAGATWSSVKLLIASKDGWGYGDASLISLRDGRVLCFYVASRGLSFWDDGGLASDDWELRLAESADDGDTWTHHNITDELRTPLSRQENLAQLTHSSEAPSPLMLPTVSSSTKSITHPEICAAFFSSGNGIELSTGRIVQPLVWRGESERLPHVSMVLSDDGGETWRLSSPIPGQADETKVAEGNNGRIYAAIRSYPERLFSVSDDGGETWSEPEPSVSEPGCNAGFTRWNGAWALTIPQPYAVDRNFLSSSTSGSGTPKTTTIEHAKGSDEYPAANSSTHEAMTTRTAESTPNLSAAPILSDPSCGRSASDLQDWSARRHLCLLTSSDLDSLTPALTIDPDAAAYSVALPLPDGHLAIVWEHGNYDEIRFTTIEP